MARIYHMSDLEAITAIMKRVGDINAEILYAQIASVTIKDEDENFLGTIKYDYDEDAFVFSPTLEDTLE